MDDEAQALVEDAVKDWDWLTPGRSKRLGDKGDDATPADVDGALLALESEDELELAVSRRSTKERTRLLLPLIATSYKLASEQSGQRRGDETARGRARKDVGDWRPHPSSCLLTPSSSGLLGKSQGGLIGAREERGAERGGADGRLRRPGPSLDRRRSPCAVCPPGLGVRKDWVMGGDGCPSSGSVEVGPEA